MERIGGTAPTIGKLLERLAALGVVEEDHRQKVGSVLPPFAVSRLVGPTLTRLKIRLRVSTARSADLAA